MGLIATGHWLVLGNPKWYSSTGTTEELLKPRWKKTNHLRQSPSNLRGWLILNIPCFLVMHPSTSHYIYLYPSIPSGKLTLLWKITMIHSKLSSTINGHLQVRKLLVITRPGKFPCSYGFSYGFPSYKPPFSHGFPPEDLHNMRHPTISRSALGWLRGAHHCGDRHSLWCRWEDPLQTFQQMWADWSWAAWKT